MGFLVTSLGSSVRKTSLKTSARIPLTQCEYSQQRCSCLLNARREYSQVREKGASIAREMRVLASLGAEEARECGFVYVSPELRVDGD